MAPDAILDAYQSLRRLGTVPAPIMCLEFALRQYAESFRGVFSTPQFPQHVGAGVCSLPNGAR